MTECARIDYFVSNDIFARSCLERMSHNMLDNAKESASMGVSAAKPNSTTAYFSTANYIGSSICTTFVTITTNLLSSIRE